MHETHTHCQYQQYNQDFSVRKNFTDIVLRSLKGTNVGLRKQKSPESNLRGTFNAMKRESSFIQTKALFANDLRTSQYCRPRNHTGSACARGLVVCHITAGRELHPALKIVLLFNSTVSYAIELFLSRAGLAIYPISQLGYLASQKVSAGKGLNPME